MELLNISVYVWKNRLFACQYGRWHIDPEEISFYFNGKYLAMRPAQFYLFVYPIYALMGSLVTKKTT